MQKIKTYVDYIDEELADAKKYIEKSIECRVEGNMLRTNKYKDLASDEIKHANIVHAMAIEDIEKLNELYQPTPEMLEIWKKSHMEYEAKMSWLEKLLEIN